MPLELSLKDLSHPVNPHIRVWTIPFDTDDHARFLNILIHDSMLRSRSMTVVMPVILGPGPCMRLHSLALGFCPARCCLYVDIPSP